MDEGGANGQVISRNYGTKRGNNQRRVDPLLPNWPPNSMAAWNWNEMQVQHAQLNRNHMCISSRQDFGRTYISDSPISPDTFHTYHSEPSLLYKIPHNPLPECHNSVDEIPQPLLRSLSTPIRCGSEGAFRRTG